LDATAKKLLKRRNGEVEEMQDRMLQDVEANIQMAQIDRSREVIRAE
jgi:hypothetical protein